MSKTFYLTNTSINKEYIEAADNYRMLESKREREIEMLLNKRASYASILSNIYGVRWAENVSFNKIMKICKEVTNTYGKVYRCKIDKNVNKEDIDKLNKYNNNYITRYIEKEYGKKIREEIGWIKTEEHLRTIKRNIKNINSVDINKDIKKELICVHNPYKIDGIVSLYRECEKYVDKETAEELLNVRIEMAKRVMKIMPDKGWRITDFLRDGLLYEGNAHIIIGNWLEQDMRKNHALKIIDEFKLNEKFDLINISQNAINNKMYSLLKAYEKAYKKDESAYEFLREELMNELKELEYVRSYTHNYSRMRLQGK